MLGKYLFYLMCNYIRFVCEKVHQFQVEFTNNSKFVINEYKSRKTETGVCFGEDSIGSDEEFLLTGWTQCEAQGSVETFDPHGASKMSQTSRDSLLLISTKRIAPK